MMRVVKSEIPELKSQAARMVMLPLLLSAQSKFPTKFRSQSERRHGMYLSRDGTGVRVLVGVWAL